MLSVDAGVHVSDVRKVRLDELITRPRRGRGAGDVGLATVSVSSRPAVVTAAVDVGRRRRRCRLRPRGAVQSLTVALETDEPALVRRRLELRVVVLGVPLPEQTTISGSGVLLCAHKDKRTHTLKICDSTVVWK